MDTEEKAPASPEAPVSALKSTPKLGAAGRRRSISRT